MENDLKNWRSVVAMASIITGLTIVPTPRAWAEKGTPNPRVIPPHAYPFGKSYGEWSAEWWKWHFRLPATDHPASSEDGANCDAGQLGKVWFLAAAFTNEFPDPQNPALFTIDRESCSLPTGKAIFFPIINVECSTVDPDEAFRREDPGELEDCAKSFVDGPNAVVQDLFVTIDSKPLGNLEEAYRFQSPVFNFSFEDPNDNILEVDCIAEDCDNPQSASDGYWIMLPPLPRGNHTINFAGSFRDPETGDLLFGLDVTYTLAVVGGIR